MTMDNVVNFNGKTKLDIDPDNILKGAVGELESAIVLGYVKHSDGEEWFASSYSDNRKTLWLLERMKKHLLEGGETKDEAT